MRSALRFARILWRDRRGASAVEYGVLLAAIAAIFLIGLRAMAEPTLGYWNNVHQRVSENTPGS